MIHAPTPAMLRAANASSAPVLPPAWPNMRLKVRVGMAQSMSCRPPLPSGCSRLCSGPAP
jgi:hypothetical protein